MYYFRNPITEGPDVLNDLHFKGLGEIDMQGHFQQG